MPPKITAAQRATGPGLVQSGDPAGVPASRGREQFGLHGHDGDGESQLTAALVSAHHLTEIAA